MSPLSSYVSETVIAFSLLVLGTTALRDRGIFRREDAPAFTKLLTHAILPVTIFHQLFTYRLSARAFLPVLVLLLVTVVSLAVSGLAGFVLRLDRPTIGALMIVSSFGAPALAGYSIVEYVFATDPGVLAHGVGIGELAVGLPVYLLCPAVAMIFGESRGQGTGLGTLAREYFASPIVLAVVAGLAASRYEVSNDAPVLGTVTAALQMVQGSLVVVSAVVLGLHLSFERLDGFWKLILVSLAVQTLLQPSLLSYLAGGFGVGAQDHRVLVLVATLPAAFLGPVFAVRHGCAARTTTLLTFAQIGISPFLVPVLFRLLG